MLHMSFERLNYKYFHFVLRGTFFKYISQEIFTFDLLATLYLLSLEVMCLQLSLERNVSFGWVLGKVLIFDLQLGSIVPADLRQLYSSFDGDGLLRGKSLSTVIGTCFLFVLGGYYFLTSDFLNFKFIV